MRAAKTSLIFAQSERIVLDLTSTAIWGLIAVAIAIFVVARIAASREPRRAAQRARRAKVRDYEADENLARLSGAERAELETLLAQNRKQEAVKLCRSRLNIGRTQAGDVIERLERADQKEVPGTET